jgi:hypothetical protein
MSDAVSASNPCQCQGHGHGDIPSSADTKATTFLSKPLLRRLSPLKHGYEDCAEFLAKLDQLHRVVLWRIRGKLIPNKYNGRGGRPGNPLLNGSEFRS